MLILPRQGTVSSVTHRLVRSRCTPGVELSAPKDKNSGASLATLLLTPRHGKT
uniref:Uncharacterized protein n=1 Tax=Anopheles dirus TaxID=7168 RepID=A0A182NY33_9DIPT